MDTIIQALCNAFISVREIHSATKCNTRSTHIVQVGFPSFFCTFSAALCSRDFLFFHECVEHSVVRQTSIHFPLGYTCSQASTELCLPLLPAGCCHLVFMEPHHSLLFRPNTTKEFTIVFCETEYIVIRNSKLAGPSRIASKWISWHRRITPTVYPEMNSRDI